MREIHDEEEGWAPFELCSMAGADVAAVLALLQMNRLPTHGVGDHTRVSRALPAESACAPFCG